VRPPSPRREGLLFGATALGALVAGATPPGRRLVALAWSGVPANAAMALAPVLVHLAAPSLTATWRSVSGTHLP
jgi:hypothetical protein